MKNKSSHQNHPNQEDKSGKPAYASQTRRNASTNSTKADDVGMPDGAETELKEELVKQKNNGSKGNSDRKPNQ